MIYKFVIYAPSYNEKSGGSMLLHLLCDLLRKQGEDAYIWPQAVPNLRGEGLLKFVYKRILLAVRLLVGKKYRTSSLCDTPIARSEFLNDAIVVYPEIVDNNPLCARYVVRWLLHKPGFHTGRENFCDGDLFFCFQDAFNSVELNPDGNTLMIIFGLYGIYKQYNFGPRSGVCYILRKGADRAKEVDLSDGIIIDNLSHSAIAELFNQCEYCISYDMHTMYSIYASLCGCKSIIVPELGVSKEEWQPNPAMRYGLAYGEGDLEYAQKTRAKMHENILKIESDNVIAVKEFAQKCKKYFSS